MKNLEKIALLIDADNTQLSKLETVIQELSCLWTYCCKKSLRKLEKRSSEKLGR